MSNLSDGYAAYQPMHETPCSISLFLQSLMLALKEKSLLFMNDRVTVILVEVFKGLNAYANVVATSGPAPPKSGNLASVSV